MFINNKYTKWYYSIINAAQLRLVVDIYSEKHHILPKSLGGENNKSNLVTLTAREHFVCHLLLMRMVEGKDKQKMALALKMLTRLKDKVKITSHTFQYIREESSKAHSAAKKGKPGRIWSTKEKKIKSIAQKGKPTPMLGLPAWNKGLLLTDEKYKGARKNKGKVAWNKGIKMGPSPKKGIKMPDGWVNPRKGITKEAYQQRNH